MSHIISQIAKPAPGPWHAEGRQVWRQDGGIRPVCNVFGPPVVPLTGPEQEATARLIAAAPDLYEALARMSELVARLGETVNWGASALDAATIRLLNEAPGEARDVLASVEGGAEKGGAERGTT